MTQMILTAKQAHELAVQLKPYISEYVKAHWDEYLAFLQDEASKGDKSAIAELEAIKAVHKGGP